MSDQQLSDFLAEIFRSLPAWVQALVAFLAGAVGISAWRRGERDRKEMAGNTMEIPVYLISGPVAETMREMHDMAEGVRSINEKYERSLQEQAAQTREIQRQNTLLEKHTQLLEATFKVLEAMFNESKRAPYERNPFPDQFRNKPKT